MGWEALPGFTPTGGAGGREESSPAERVSSDVDSSPGTQSWAGRQTWQRQRDRQTAKREPADRCSGKGMPQPPGSVPSHCMTNFFPGCEDTKLNLDTGCPTVQEKSWEGTSLSLTFWTALPSSQGAVLQDKGLRQKYGVCISEIEQSACLLKYQLPL